MVYERQLPPVKQPHSYVASLDRRVLRRPTSLTGELGYGARPPAQHRLSRPEDGSGNARSMAAVPAAASYCVQVPTQEFERQRAVNVQQQHLQQLLLQILHDNNTPDDVKKNRIKQVTHDSTLHF